MSNQAKIRINLDTKEMEIEGSESFINSHTSQIQQFLESQSGVKAPAQRKGKPGRPPKEETTDQPQEATPESTTKKKTKSKSTTTGTKTGKRGRPAKKKTAASASTTVSSASKKEQLAKELDHITEEDIQQIRNELPERFGDFFLKLPKDTKDVDKVVAGGFFVQNQGENNTFSTRETTRLLKTVGVKLSNPSQCVKYNVKTGRIKNIRRNRYRLTSEGEKYITYLLKQAG